MSAPVGTPAPAPAGAEPAAPRRLLVPTLVFLGLVSTAVGSLGAPLLPTIVIVDRVSVVNSQWALTISLLVGAVATPVLGRLGDGRRRRPVILGAVVVVMAGCVLSALPLGFTVLLVGRALQGVGLGLVPLAIAVAREALPSERSGPAIALLGVTTAVGIGIGYPVAGLLVEFAGLSSAFWFGAAVSVLALIAAAVVLPPSPDRPTGSVDVVGAVLLAVSVAGLLLVLAQGVAWGWTSTRLLTIAVVAVVVLIVWVVWELRISRPLVDLRSLRHRSVLAANLTVLLIGIGIYPLLSIVVRLVQSPAATGYGIGASPLIAGLMLVPFSVTSFAASKVSKPLFRRLRPEPVVSLSTVLLIAAMALYLVAFRNVGALVGVMAIAGFGVGLVFAANPLQIIAGVPKSETGSASSFYQVLRSIGFSAGSALSSTALAARIPAGGTLPSAEGYRDAGIIGIAVLAVAFVVATLLARAPKTARAGTADATGTGTDNASGTDTASDTATGTPATEPEAPPAIHAAGPATPESSAPTTAPVGAGAPGATMWGIVHRPDGGAVTDAVVTLVDADGRELDRARCDDGGGYAMLAPGQAAIVVCSAAGHAPTALWTGPGLPGGRLDVELYPCGRAAAAPRPGGTGERASAPR